MDPALAGFAMGPIEHGEPLRRAYSSATLTIQAAPHGFWHQRAFEATMSGSLVLTRFTPADFGGFSADAYRRRLHDGEPPTGTHAVFPTPLDTVFEDERTFGELADRWLDSTNERRRLTEGLRDCVASNFTYRSVLPRMLEQIRAVLRDTSPPPWQWQPPTNP